MSHPVIFVPVGIDGYELCQPVNHNDFERLNAEINGTARIAGWTPVSMNIVRRDNGKRLRRSDSPWLGSHSLVFRGHAAKLLGSVLESQGELLPLACDESEMWVFNPRQVDAFDEAASSVTRFSSGRIMMIQQHAFLVDRLRDVDAFKVPNLRVSPTFVSERFVQQWRESNLIGLHFKPVWPPR